MVGKVKIGNEGSIGSAEVGSFDGIQQIATAAVSLITGGGVGERQEYAAAIPLDPVKRQLAAERITQPNSARERPKLQRSIRFDCGCQGFAVLHRF